MTFCQLKYSFFSWFWTTKQILQVTEYFPLLLLYLWAKYEPIWLELLSKHRFIFFRKLKIVYCSSKSVGTTNHCFVIKFSHISVGRLFGYSNIFKYIKTNIFIHLNICWFFPRQIYADIHWWSICTDEYIPIFIGPISMIAKTFEFSVFLKNC